MSRLFATKTREMALALSFEFCAEIQIPLLKFRKRGKSTLPQWHSFQNRSHIILTRMSSNFMKRLWILGLVSTRLFLPKWLLQPFSPLISHEFLPAFSFTADLGARKLL